jgi:aryl-alcohol dehydrogenase-like predicted oxidoreductase
VACAFPKWPRCHDLRRGLGLWLVRDEARRIYEAYRAAGGNFIDTANVYTAGTSESLLDKFMRDEIVANEAQISVVRYAKTVRGEVRKYPGV